MSKRPGLFSEVSDLSPSGRKRARPGSSPKGRPGPDQRNEGASELGEEDGVDPRYIAKRRRRAREDERPGVSHGVHKHEQLLAQVGEAVESALQCAATEILGELTVCEVAPQGSAVAIVVGPRNPEAPLDTKAAKEALERASSMLSREVASAITRKECPKLSFIVLPAGAQKVEE